MTSIASSSSAFSTVKQTSSSSSSSSEGYYKKYTIEELTQSKNPYFIELIKNNCYERQPKNDKTNQYEDGQILADLTRSSWYLNGQHTFDLIKNDLLDPRPKMNDYLLNTLGYLQKGILENCHNQNPTYLAKRIVELGIPKNLEKGMPKIFIDFTDDTKNIISSDANETSLTCNTGIKHLFYLANMKRVICIDNMTHQEMQVTFNSFWKAVFKERAYQFQWVEISSTSSMSFAFYDDIVMGVLEDIYRYVDRMKIIDDANYVGERGEGSHYNAHLQLMNFHEKDSQQLQMQIVNAKQDYEDLKLAIKKLAESINANVKEYEKDKKAYQDLLKNDPKNADLNNKKKNLEERRKFDETSKKNLKVLFDKKEETKTKLQVWTKTLREIDQKKSELSIRSLLSQKPKDLRRVSQSMQFTPQMVAEIYKPIDDDKKEALTQTSPAKGHHKRTSTVLANISSSSSSSFITELSHDPRKMKNEKFMQDLAISTMKLNSKSSPKNEPLSASNSASTLSLSASSRTSPITVLPMSTMPPTRRNSFVSTESSLLSQSLSSTSSSNMTIRRRNSAENDKSSALQSSSHSGHSSPIIALSPALLSSLNLTRTISSNHNNNMPTVKEESPLRPTANSNSLLNSSRPNFTSYILQVLSANFPDTLLFSAQGPSKVQISLGQDTILSQLVSVLNQSRRSTAFSYNISSESSGYSTIEIVKSDANLSDKSSSSMSSPRDLIQAVETFSMTSSLTSLFNANAISPKVSSSSSSIDLAQSLSNALTVPSQASSSSSNDAAMSHSSKVTSSATATTQKSSSSSSSDAASHTLLSSSSAISPNASSSSSSIDLPQSLSNALTVPCQASSSSSNNAAMSHSSKVTSSAAATTQKSSSSSSSDAASLTSLSSSSAISSLAASSSSSSDTTVNSASMMTSSLTSLSSASAISPLASSSSSSSVA